MALVLGRAEGQSFLLDPQGPEPIEVIVMQIAPGMARFKVIHGFRDARNWRVDRVSVTSGYASHEDSLVLGEGSEIQFLGNRKQKIALRIVSVKQVVRLEIGNPGDEPPEFRSQREKLLASTPKRDGRKHIHGTIGGPAQ